MEWQRQLCSFLVAIAQRQASPDHAVPRLTRDREPLLAVNTHLINFVNTNKFQAQLQEIAAIIN